jgi:crossover junction endodeoxyribonuclease RusA
MLEVKPNLIVIRYPNKKLNPNQRLHWAAKLEAKNNQKTEAFYAAKKANLTFAIDVKKRLGLKIVFHRADARAFDIDNAFASLKAALDGISQALGINDSKFRPITLDVGNDRDGTVKIYLHEQL